MFNRLRSRGSDNYDFFELPEILGMSDRVLVIHKGTITVSLMPGKLHRKKFHLAADHIWKENLFPN